MDGEGCRKDERTRRHLGVVTEIGEWMVLGLDSCEASIKSFPQRPSDMPIFG
jgi:hypothetical protein